VTTTPAVPLALRPTAIQSWALGHEMAVRAGAGVIVSDCAVQVFPPSTVASMTVAGVGGTEEVVAVVPEGPGAPTAQQWVGPAQVTASSWPVPAGAGCPTTAGTPFCWPRTLGGAGALAAGAVVQAAAVSPSVTSTAARWAPRCSRARHCGREGLDRTAQGH